MSYPAQQPQAQQAEPAVQEMATLAPDWPFSHLHFDRRARTWVGHVDEAFEALPRRDDGGSRELRRA